MSVFSDKYKKKEEEEKFSFLNKYKFTTDVGIGAKAEMGVTLTEEPSVGVSQRMRGVGEPPEKYPFEGITIELKEAQKRLSGLWWSEIKTTEDKWKFLKHENWSEELQQADLEVMRLSEQASEMGVNMKDWINYGVYAAFFATMAAGILPILSGLPKNILNNLAYKVEGKTVKGKELLKTLQRVTYPDPRAGFGAPSKFDRKIFDEFVKQGGLKGIGKNLKTGVTIPEITPRFAFGTKLYAGLPADEIVKSLVEVGKVTTDMVKGLDPVKVSQVTQQLLNINPVLANEFLKAVEKPDVKPVVEKAQIGLEKLGNIISDEVGLGDRKIKWVLKDHSDMDLIEKQYGVDTDNWFGRLGGSEENPVITIIPPYNIKNINKEEFLEAIIRHELGHIAVPQPEHKGEYSEFVNKMPPITESNKKNIAFKDILAKYTQTIVKPKIPIPKTKEEIYAKKYDIPLDKVKITKIPKVEEPETAEALRILQKAKIEPEEIPKVEPKLFTAKERLEAKFKEAKEIRIEKGFAEKPYVLKKDLSAEQKTEGNKLIGQIQGLVSSKGLTKKEFTSLKQKYGLSPHLATDTRRMTMPQLQAVFKAVERARPKRIGWQKVVTPKTEKKIQSLKTTLIDKLQMTEEAYQVVLKDVGVYKEPKYIDAKQFITEKQGKDIIYRLIDESNILRVTMPFDKAVTENKVIKVDVDKLDRRIKIETDRKLKDPHELSSMRVNIQRMETITGAPIYPIYQDLINAHLKNKQKLGTFVKGFEPYKEILKDENELKKVNDYILAKSNLKDKPSVPANITEKEIKLAKKIEGILKDYEAKARTEKFLDNIDHPEDMPQYLEYKKEIDKAKDIYESKGYDELIEYMKTQKWGVIKSGYSPLQVLSPKIRLYKPKAQTFGKGHIKVRTDIEYHEQDRNIIQRLFSYKKQMDNLVTMRPKVRALITLIDKNISKFKDPPRISRNMETFFRELKGYNRPENWFDRGLNRLYAQAMQTIIMPSPVLSGRNLLQNIAFGHDKSLLIDPRNKSLTADELEYFHTYISQLEAMKADWLMVGEKPLPGLATLTKIVRKIGIYPYSDLANRHWGYWAKINQVKRAFAKNVNLDKKMKASKFSDMELIEQKMALQILAKDGEEAMARYVARVYVDNTQFLYDRSQRSLAEMGRVGKWAGNLMLFPRAYWELLLKQSKKMTGKYIPVRERIRAFKVLASIIGGGILVGAAYKKVTGRKENPYDPLVLLAYEPGGLAIGTVEAVTDVYINIIMASKGDDRALAALTTAIPKAADMFIPFYAYTLRALEASTDTKNIDRKALRKIRMLINKEYKLRGGAYELERKAMEKWQYFLSGAGVDVIIKEREAKKKEIISPYLKKYKETFEPTVSSYLKKYK